MKLIVLSLASFLAATVALGQGSVWLSNKLGVKVNTPFFDDKGVLLEGPSYVAQLYAWKIGDGFVPICVPVPFATNGYFFGSSVDVLFAPLFGSAWVQVRAWDAGGGATFEEAALAGAWTGVSADLFLPVLGFPSGRICSPQSATVASERGVQSAQILGPPTPPAVLIGLEYPGPPLMVRPPQDQTLQARERATLSVVASSGVTASYQWHQQPSERPDGLIPGATNATYTTPPLFTTTRFWVVVNNSAGSTTSDPATVTVLGSSFLSLTLVEDRKVPRLVLEGQAGELYRLEYATNLNASTWTPLWNFMQAGDSFRDIETSNSPMRFYRAVLLP